MPSCIIFTPSNPCFGIEGNHEPGLFATKFFFGKGVDTNNYNFNISKFSYKLLKLILAQEWLLCDTQRIVEYRNVSLKHASSRWAPLPTKPSPDIEGHVGEDVSKYILE